MVGGHAFARALLVPLAAGRASLPNRGIDLAAVLGLSLAGALLRWPGVLSAPRLTDEIIDGARALLIVQGRLLPLTNFNSYIGAFHNYLLAGVFLIFGANPWYPRLVSCVLGAATVGLTYLLAAEIGGRRAGLLAGAMMATAAVHILVNSHLAWAHSTTPFYTTLALWLLVRGIQRRSGRSIAGSGFVFGLALQSHLLAATFLPAAGLYALWKGRRWVRTPWPYLAVLLLLVAYSNVIIYNLQTAGDTLDRIQYRRMRHNYLNDGPLPEDDPRAYVQNLARTAALLSRVAASSVDPRDNWPAPVDTATTIGAGLVVAASLVWCARAGQPLPLLAVLSSGLILALVNPGRYAVITDGRYLTPLLPVCFAALAAALVAHHWRSPLVQRLALAGTLGLFVLQPLGPLVHFLGRAAEEPPQNEALAKAVDLLVAHSQGGEIVLLDNRLNLGARNIISLRESRAAFDGFGYLLPFTGLPHEVLQVTRAEVAEHLHERPRIFAIVPPGYRSELLDGEPTRLRSPEVPIPDDPVVPGRPLYELFLIERASS